MEALPRAQATATYRIVNNTAATARIRTEIRAPQGWGSDALPLVAEVPAGGTDTVFVTLLLPANAAASAYPIELTATDADTGAELQRFNFVVQVGRVQSLNATSAWPEESFATAGQSVTQTLVLINQGNAAESLSITARSSPEWPTTVSPAQLTLAGGESAEVAITLSIPTDVLTGGDMHLMFIEVRASGTPEDQPPLTSIVNRTRVVLGSRDARLGPVYGTFTGNWTQRVNLSEDSASYDTRLSLVAPLGEGQQAAIEAQSPVWSVGEANYFSQEHFRVAFDDLRRGFFHAGDISVDLDQPLLFYSRNGRGLDMAAITGRTMWRTYYVEDRFGLGLLSAGAQIRRRFDRGVVGSLSYNHELDPGNAFRPESDQSNTVDAQLVLTPDLRNELRLEAATSASHANGTGQAQRIYGRTTDRNFYAIGEVITTSEDFAGAYRDEDLARFDASLAVTSDIRPWVSYSFHEENPGWQPARERTLDESSRAGIDWTVYEDTQLRYSRLETVRKDSISSPLGEKRREDSYEFAQRWGDLRLVLGADIGELRDRDQDRVFDSRRYRMSSTFDIPRGTLSLDYFRDLNAQFGGVSTLREDYLLRTHLRVAKVQELRADLRYSPGGFFGPSGNLLAEWRLGYPERWRVTVNHSFGAGSDTTLQAEYHQPVRMPFKAFPVGGIIAGRIYRRDNNAGIANARLIIDERSILTDEDGNYSLRGVTPGEHIIELDIATIGAGVTTELVFPLTTAVQAGQTATLDIPVTVSASIAGTVTQTGATDILPSQPAAGAVVELKPAAGGASQLRQTDGLGRFRFGEVEAGEYSIHVRAGTPEEPMESLPSEATVTVEPGEQVTDIDFLLKPKPREIQIMIGE